MTNTYTQRYKGFPIISDQITKTELGIILEQLERTQPVPGDVVEFGCYEGTTSLFLQRALSGTGKILHVYDSFAGLPVKHAVDQSPTGEQFRAGELHASKTTLLRHFKRAGLPSPIIHKGWFHEFTPADVPPVISFAFLDGDFYQSILDSLHLVWPRLSKGAIVVVDDYHTEALPGVHRALHEWAKNHQFTLRNQASLAILSV